MSGAAVNEQERVTLELKICERCGGLWLRPSVSRWIYCGGCKKKISELPKPSMESGQKRRRARAGNPAGVDSAQVIVRSERVQ
jgi:Zn-finger nucleic acid-binding protein